ASAFGLTAVYNFKRERTFQVRLGQIAFAVPGGSKFEVPGNQEAQEKGEEKNQGYTLEMKPLVKLMGQTSDPGPLNSKPVHPRNEILGIFLIIPPSRRL